MLYPIPGVATASTAGCIVAGLTAYAAFDSSATATIRERVFIPRRDDFVTIASTQPLCSQSTLRSLSFKSPGRQMCGTWDTRGVMSTSRRGDGI